MCCSGCLYPFPHSFVSLAVYLSVRLLQFRAVHPHVSVTVSVRQSINRSVIVGLFANSSLSVFVHVYFRASVCLFLSVVPAIRMTFLMSAGM